MIDLIQASPRLRPGADKVVLFAATLEEIAMFLKADDKAKKRLMH